MSVPLRLAARYLFSRRSGNVTGRISAVSVAGMAIGTAALILVLSVYNGFGEIIERNISTSSPDWVVSAVDGGTISVPAQFCAENPADSVSSVPPPLYDVVQVVRQRVFASYDGSESVVMALGRSDAAACSVSADVASVLGVRPARLEMLRLYFPDREASISLSNPAASLRSINVHPSMLFSPKGEDEAGTVILPIGKARELLGYGADEVSELHLRDCPRPEGLPDGLQVLDRYQQHRDLYKMKRSE
ncbi:MAG: ABC transporter permease, partial [Bacteroidales bacterium]|nr:ABC transporter permease [Candidatus Cryptobacteroides aphodequi]